MSHQEIDPNRSPTSLVLDVIERLTVVEQGQRFADIHREALIKAINRLTDKIDDLRQVPDRLKAVEKLVTELKEQVETHDDFVKELKTGMKIGGKVWAVIYTCLGAGGATLLQWLLEHRG